MKTVFDPCEADFFGDLASDTHGLWEVFEFVRLHNPGSTDREVFEIGNRYIARWIRKGWISVSNTPLFSSTVTTTAGLLQFLQDNGRLATEYMENSPSLDTTEKGSLEWKGYCAAAKKKMRNPS
jgi:hypothetical protein